MFIVKGGGGLVFCSGARKKIKYYTTCHAQWTSSAFQACQPLFGLKIVESDQRSTQSD